MEEVVEERVVDAVRTFSPLMPANRRIEVRSTRCAIFVVEMISIGQITLYLFTCFLLVFERRVSTLIY